MIFFLRFSNKNKTNMFVKKPTISFFPDIAERVDIVFALDGSKNVDSETFEKIKRFIQGAAGAYKIGAKQTRIGLLTYGETPVNNLHPLDGIRTAVVTQKIFDAKPVGGERKINNAIQFADRVLFDDQKTDAKSKVFVLIVAGPDAEGIADRDTKVALRRLKKKNVSVLVTAIGKQVNMEELKDVAMDDKVIAVPEIGEIKEALTKVMEESIKATG